MANEFINGRKSLLFLDTVTPITTPLDEVTPENFKMVACLTNNGFDGTTSAIATTSKCSGSFAESLDGEKGWTMSGEGNAIDIEIGDERISHNALFKQWRSGAAAWWAIMDADLLNASATLRYGVGRIDSQGDAFPDNEAQTFTVSITGIGEPGDQDDMAPITT